MRKLTFLIIIIYFLSISVITMAEEEHYINVAVIDSGIGENIEVLDYSKILKGKSYIEGITSYIDKIGHGTAVAGLIQSNAPNINIVPLMYYCQYPSGVTLNGGIDGICRAIYDAVDVYKCKIINISSGIYTENNELKNAVEYAESKGVIVISAVGNDRISAKDRVFYPAAYSTVIGVGAVDNDFKVGDFSQRNESVMTVAYGVDVEVISIRNSSHYVTVSGTSFAAANFCGLAASVIGEYPEITPKEFRELIECSSIDLGEPGYDNTYGYGLIDKDIMLKNIKK
jgi:subtilisin family serine protease